MRSLLSAVVLAFLSAGTLQAEQPGALGVTLRDNPSGGVSIDNVIANSPAAQIGLLPGDRILSINSQPTNNYSDVSRIIDAAHANAQVELSVARGPWQCKMTAVLGYAANVLGPNRQYVSVAPIYASSVPVSRPMVSAPNDVEEWQFPRNLYNDGKRGASASRGMLGY